MTPYCCFVVFSAICLLTTSVNDMGRQLPKNQIIISIDVQCPLCLRTMCLTPCLGEDNVKQNNPPAATHTTLISILSMHRQTPKVLLLCAFGFSPNLANYPSNFLHSLRPPTIPMEIWLRIFIRNSAAQNTRSKSFNDQ